jgi:hypothetical protein
MQNANFLRNPALPGAAAPGAIARVLLTQKNLAFPGFAR